MCGGAACSRPKGAGFRYSHLPLEISQRVRTGKSVIGATILNFFFLGVGYDYLGKWWGLLFLEIYLLLFFISQLLVGISVTIMIMVPFNTLFATQTYLMAREGGSPARVIVWWIFQTSSDKKSRISRS